MKPTVLVALVFGLLLAGQVLVAQTAVTGKVIQITSGDTFTLLNVRQRPYTEQDVVEPWGFGEELDLNPPPDETPTIIHLAGIDAPEKDQPYGDTSRQKLGATLLGRVVRVTYFEKDRFNHIVGTVYIGDRWINEDVLAEGCAWHDKRYSDDDELDTAEQQARARRLGLWAEAQPVEPWKWRQTHQIATPEYTEQEGQAIPGADGK
ncbi:MAG: thermonuclease family protein [Verrucomicrobia bacterium]|nr:thermonuclease family protein [Verrucomicrobiota bacterium]MBU1734682.1 thermonuclease family protein [Verrucomicrobiota bacterium]MBU1856116.1 thermonuclease family protein [Verrucomicrobiota bacterium]